MGDLNVLLGVTGSIWAMNSPHVAAWLLSHDRVHSVQVVMSTSAQRMTSQLPLSIVTSRPVLRDWADAEGAGWRVPHVDLAEWADVVLVAPCTLNSLVKLSLGLSDSLLTTICSASGSPVVVAPSMSEQMWLKQATREAVDRLRSYGVVVLDPGEGVSSASGRVETGSLTNFFKQVRDILYNQPRVARDN